METVPTRRWIIGDTETAGFGDKKRACQVGLLEFDPVTFKPIWEFCSLVDPEVEMSSGAQAIHGISDEMVADEPTFTEMIEHRLGGHLVGPITMVCHNVSFDEDLLQPLGGIDDFFCTLEEARRLMPKGGRVTPGPENHKLVTLAAYLGFTYDGAHDALADCHATLKLLEHLVKISGKSLEQLAAVKVREVLTMPWGLHARQPLTAIPASYLQWLLTLENLHSNLRNSVTKELSLR